MVGIRIGRGVGPLRVHLRLYDAIRSWYFSLKVTGTYVGLAYRCYRVHTPQEH
jgi:hypothetical protein